MRAVAGGLHRQSDRLSSVPCAAPTGPGLRRSPARRYARREDRWRALDGAPAKGHDEPVTPRPAAERQEAGASTRSHEDALLRLLYEQHAGPLLMFVLRLTGGDRQRAEDIVQETLLRAWRNAHKLGAQGQASLRPWLVTVARRIAIDDYRSDNARPMEIYDRELEGFPSADESDRVLQMMTITDALRTLSRVKGSRFEVVDTGAIER